MRSTSKVTSQPSIPVFFTLGSPAGMASCAGNGIRTASIKIPPLNSRYHGRLTLPYDKLAWNCPSAVPFLSPAWGEAPSSTSHLGWTCNCMKMLFDYFALAELPLVDSIHLKLPVLRGPNLFGEIASRALQMSSNMVKFRHQLLKDGLDVFFSQ